MEPEHTALRRFLTEWRSASATVRAHTSGSTGTPKAIELLKADMRVSALATCRRFAIGADSVLFLPLSLDYIAGKMMAVRAEVSGARLIVERPSNRPLLADPGADITLAAIVPSQVEGLLVSPYAGRVRNVIVGGAPLSPTQERMLRDAPFDSFATYGMTETCSHVALRDIKAADDCYNAMPGISFSVDTRGCLIVEAPEYSARRFVTNDLVDLVSPRRFRWLGRYDNVINSGGVKVMPEAVEALLRPLLPEGLPYRIASRPDDKWGSIVVLEVAGKVDAEAVIKAAKEVLTPAQMPKTVVEVASIPLTSNGKIARRQKAADVSRDDR